jgi:16S rRNA (uracil1498-N3)-methyltransferase
MRIYLSPESILIKTGIILPPDKARHVVSVMRCKKDDEITIFDGQGRSYVAQITGTQKRNVSIDILQESTIDTESSAHLVLCQGILKGEKMDSVIQDSVELGIKEIIPLITGRSQVKETRKTKRWRKIAEEAAEQCGRSVVPDIREPQTFGNFLTSFISAEAPHGIIFWEEGGFPLEEAFNTAGLSNAGPFLLFIGPEGGLLTSEVEMAESRGFIRATLGRRILRAETAAVVAVALIQFLAEKNKTAGKI